ncbi:MAG: hypothetical protein GX025_10360, partial [Clostridiales bacterium]|nr:hypothetical protein [Clostridiales bacterium]
EFPIDFMFRLYNENNDILYTDNITNNESVFWTKDIVQINEVVKMEIEILKWNTPNRVIKIMEVFSSIQEIYEGEDIISISLIEERETSQGSLPVGNISSNEIEVVFNNVNREFDVGNVDSNLYRLVKPNRKITAWIGVENELIPIGVFWTKDWDVPEDGLVAKTIGRDRLDRLRDTEYTTSKVETNKSIYQLAETILNDAGLKENQYWLDAELKDYTIPYAYFKPVSHREALRQLATACIGQVYCNRQGVIRFEGPGFALNRIDEVKTLAFLQAELPTEVEVIDSYGISGDDYFSKDNPSKQSDIANHITIETQPLEVKPNQELYSAKDLLAVRGLMTQMTINYNSVPAINVNVEVSGDVVIVSEEIYSWGTELYIFAPNNSVNDITVTGQPLVVSNKDNITVKDSESIIENGTIRYKLPNNHLIQSRGIAEIVAEKLLRYHKDPKRDVEIDWRGNPALELGDIIRVNDYPRGTNETIGYYYVTKQELEFMGYLRASMEGRRV